MGSTLARRFALLIGLVALAGWMLIGVVAPVLSAGSKVGVCHQTGSVSNPVVFIEVAPEAVPAHRAHGDRINVTREQCLGVAPTPTPTPTPGQTPTPTPTPTPSPTPTP